MDLFLQKLSTFGNALPGDITQGLIWGIMAIGVFITYKILDFADLTVDGTLGLGGVTAVVLITNGVPVPVAMLIAFLAGCMAGLCTALLNTMLGIPGILAGILTQLALYSVYLDINGKANAPVSVDKFPLVISSRYVTAGNEVVDIIRTVGTALIFVVVIIAALYWFFGTEYGMAIRANGCNSAMSKAEGINTKRTTIIALVLSNGMVGLAGALLAQYQGFADVNMGRGAIVIGLAAVIIGMVSRRGDTAQALQLYRQAFIYGSRRHSLLRGSENRNADRSFHRQHQDVLRNNRCAVPCGALPPEDLKDLVCKGGQALTGGYIAGISESDLRAEKLCNSRK